MSEYELAKTIHSAIRNSNSRWDRSTLLDKHTTMRGAIASQLSYAIGEKPIDYVTAIVDDEDKRVEVAVFAGDRIAWLSNHDGGSDVTTTIHSRNGIDGVELVSTPNVLAGGFSESGSLQVRLSLGTYKLLLPGDPNATSRNVEQLEAYLPLLLPGSATATS